MEEQHDKLTVDLELGASSCDSCLYRRGLIKTFINPCPQCRANGYSFAKKPSLLKSFLSRLKGENPCDTPTIGIPKEL